MVRPLVRSKINPNQVTTLRLVSGVVAAAALSIGTHWWNQAGCIAFVVSVVLDRADGELARMSGKTSAKGHKYDLWADACSNVLVFIGLGVGLRDSVLAPWSVPLGVVAGVSVAAVFWLVLQIEADKGQRAAELPGVAGFDPDDAILLVPLFIWLGWSVPLLVAAAVGAGVFALFFYWLFLRRRSRNNVSKVQRQ